MIGNPHAILNTTQHLFAHRSSHIILCISYLDASTSVLLAVVLLITLLLLLGMWNLIRNILGQDTDTDNEDDEPEHVSAPDYAVSSSEPVSDEHREFVGVVTSLHSAYGLINHEICFTMDAVSGSLPKTGDKVHVVACRKNAVGGWRAKRVWAASDDDFLSEPEPVESCQLHVPSTPSNASDGKAVLLASEQDRRELLKDKDGLSVTESADFGNMQLGDSASLTIVVRYCFVH